MSQQGFAAIVALRGIVISAGVSLIVSVYSSKRQTNIEMQKMRTEFQARLADKIIEKRLEVYPQLYYLLSRFLKQEAGTISQQDLIDLSNQINEWNSKNSVLFSSFTGSLSSKHRNQLKDLISASDSLTPDEINALSSFDELKKYTRQFESSLKSDLGIFLLDFSEYIERFMSHSELVEAREAFISQRYEERKSKRK